MTSSTQTPIEVDKAYENGTVEILPTSRAQMVKALQELRKDQPGVTAVHVDAPIGVTGDFVPTARTLLGKLRAKFTTVPESQPTVLKADGKAACEFCDKLATGDTDPPTCDDHKGMKVTKALSGLTVIKSVAKQFTYGPLYLPNSIDAHGDWTHPDDLQKAVWDMHRSGHRTVNVQHIPGTVAGEWVELATVPWAHEAELTVPGGELRKAKFPAMTPWMGVIWGDTAWAEVQAGRLRGLSMEGTAQRVMADLPGLEAV